MEQKNGIKSWAEDDRPREKLLSKGPSSLSDAELLAILIGSGTREKSAVDLARELLTLSNNNLNKLGKIGLVELQQVKGIGEARAITIAATMELGRRRQMEAALDQPKIDSAKAAAALLFPLLQDLNHEMFCVLYLNNANRLIKHEMISSGGLTATIVDVRMVLKNALLCQAAGLIVAHNHPSGNNKPSESDKTLTKKIAESAKLMDINLLDHIIIAGKEYVSFADSGLL